MIDQIKASLSFQSEALKLRAQRQQVLAANIANADTPNYKAVDIDVTQALGDFAKALRTADSHARSDASKAFNAPQIRDRTNVRAGLDGNTVDMDAERIQFADNALRYEATLRFINGKLRTLLSAIQG
jgi:flagellar basal-body rod protein FlgB